MGIAAESTTWLGWIAVAIYSVAVLILVVRGALRTRTLSDYALGSVAFSPIFVGLSLAVSMMSAATFIINPGLIALYGISGVISYAVVLPLATLSSLVILTKGFVRRGSAVGAATMAQWIGARYKSPGFALFFALLTLLLITFIVLINVGLTKVLSKTLNIGELPTLIAVVVFIFGYMMFGGANSMVYTHGVQAALMLLVALLLLGSGAEHLQDGLDGLLTRLGAIDPSLVAATNARSPLFRDAFEIIVCQAVIGLAIVCQPHILTKSLLLKSARDVNRYLVVSVGVAAIFFSVTIVGLFARLCMPDLTVNGVALKSDDIMSAYVVREFSPYMAIMVVMGLLCAGISTLESLIQSISTTITSDLIGPVMALLERRRGGSVRSGATNLVLINRGVIGVLGAVALAISHQQLVDPDLSVAMLAQNGVYAFFAAAFVPVLFGTFLQEVPRPAPIAATLSAIVVHFAVYYGELTHYMQTQVKNPAVAGAIAILVSVGIGLGVLAALKWTGSVKAVVRLRLGPFRN